MEIEFRKIYTIIEKALKGNFEDLKKEGFDLKELLNNKVFQLWLFGKEEKRILEIKDEALKIDRELLNLNLSGIRGFLLTICGFSFTITGIIGTLLFSSEKYYKHLNYLYISVGLLLFCIIWSILYLSFIYFKENNVLTNYIKFHKESTGKLHDFMIKNVSEEKNYFDYLLGSISVKENNREDEKKIVDYVKKTNRNKSFTIIFVPVLFISAILFLIFAFI